MSIELTLQVAPELSLCLSEAELKTWVEATLKNKLTKTELCIRFVDNIEMQQLNLQYRGKDKHTNVLSFPNNLPAPLKGDYLGDIVCCIPVIESEALLQHKTPQAHYAHMIVHGILHLLGYDHQTDTEASIMEEFEINILATLGFHNPYGVSQPYD